MSSIFANYLQRGDRFTRSLSDDTVITVLRDSEPCTDLFGRVMFRYWCSRKDTGAQGWMVFGESGTVQRIEETVGTDKYCPVCGTLVRYVIAANSALWVHVATGHPTFEGHDANTYAPDHLLDSPDR